MTEAPEPEDKLDAMTGVVVNGPEDAPFDWHQINWRRVEDEVRRLRQRIFTASKAGDLARVRNLVAVGTALRRDGSGCPPRRSQRALLTHWAPRLGRGVEASIWPWLCDGEKRQPSVAEAPHPLPGHRGALAAAPQRHEPKPHGLGAEGVQRLLVAGHAVVVGVSTQDAGERPCLGMGRCRRLASLPLRACSLALIRFESVIRRGLKYPALEVPQMCVNPRKRNVSGLPSPRALRFRAANRPNSIRRVFSVFSSRLNFASLSRRSAQNRSASSRYSNPTTKSSTKRTITTSPRACRVLHWWTHRSRT
jgi:N-terminal domain of reverse transcriptase